MATIRYLDAQGSTPPLDLVGDSGMLPLSALMASLANPSTLYTDDGTRIRQSIYSGTTLRFRYEYTYATVVTPNVDKIISAVNVYGSNNDLLQTWSGISFSLSSVIKTGALPVLVGEDRVEGNASANYLQGASGDDLILGGAGADTLDGGRADDTLVGGAGDDTLYGGLGTDYAAFYGASASYQWTRNDDGSLTVRDTSGSANDGADKLFDVEWLLFNYGTANQGRVQVSKLVQNETSLISGWRQFDPFAQGVIPTDSRIITDGTAWTFKQSTQTIGWAIADNGALKWPDIERMQDIIGDALEEFSKTANISFNYFGSYTSISAATAGGADFVYTLGQFSDPNTIASAFFPNYTDRTIDFNPSVVTAGWNSPDFAAFYKFVAIHETGHTLGLKHPHNVGFRNATAIASDALSQFSTVMSYYNPAGQSGSATYYPETPMSLDARALTSIYGLPTYREGIGNTVHALLSKNTYRTIVDFSGTNTLDARASAGGWQILLADSGTDPMIAQSAEGQFPSRQIVLGIGTFSDVLGSQHDDAIVGTSGRNVIQAGPGNDIVWSYGGADLIDGGEGADTLIFAEDVSALSITNSGDGGLIFKRAGNTLATARGFETYRFGYDTSSNYELSSTALRARIQDSPGTITLQQSGVAQEDQRLSVKVAVTDPDGVNPVSIQWQSKTLSGDWADIAGRVGDSIVLSQGEVGRTIRAKVVHTDLLGNVQVATGTASATVQNVNDAPQGSVVIKGSADPGATLTADTGTLSDEDGLGPLSYQWQASPNGQKWSDIAGATQSGYLVRETDAFSALRVVVRYRDLWGTDESITSSATGIVNPSNYPATGRPTIVVPQIGVREDATLTADVSGIADPDGLGRIGVLWQKQVGDNWLDIDAARSRTFTPGDAEVGLRLRVRASFVDGRGNLEQTDSLPSDVVANVNDAPRGLLRLVGSHIEDSVLSLSNTITDDDGLGALTYQWQSSINRSDWLAIAGATGPTLTLGDAQVGLSIRAVISYRDGHGTNEPVTSDISQIIRNINDAPTGIVRIAGMPTEDQTLTASVSGLADADGLGATTLQWQIEGDSGNWQDLRGATASTLVLGDAHVGRSVRALVRYVDARGTAEELASNGTAPIQNINDAPVGAVVIDGSAQTGATLSANTAGVSDADGILDVRDGALRVDPFSYQWQRSSNGTTWQDIAGQTEQSYLIAAGDASYRLRVQAGYTDLNGTLEVLTSAPTAAVPSVNSAPTGSVAINGRPQEDETLTANVTGLADADGLGTLRYQWQRSADGAQWDSIGLATQNTYRLGDADVFGSVRVLVSYVDLKGTQEAVGSPALPNITPVNDAPIGSVQVRGLLIQGGTVSADTTDLSDPDGLGELRYQWQSANEGGQFKNIPAATDKNFEVTASQVDQTLRVIVSWKDGQGFRESVTSAGTQKIQNRNDAPEGSVVLQGVAVEDGRLSIDASALRDKDGLGTLQYAWQVSKDGEVWWNRAGATDAVFLPGDAEVGLFVRVAVSYVDGRGTFESLVSNSSARVEAVDDPLTGELFLTGLLSSGRTVVADWSELADADGLGTPTFNWSTATTLGGPWATVSTGASGGYTLRTEDAGKYLRVQFAATDSQGFAEQAVAISDRVVLGGVVGRSPGEPITGTISEDLVEGGAGDDDISSGAGNDRVSTGKGADVVDAGQGNDAIYLEPDGVWVAGFRAARLDYLSSEVNRIAEYVELGGKNRYLDVIDGNAGQDTIVLADTWRGDAFFLHDFFSDFNASESTAFVVDVLGRSGTSRLGGIERILAGAGDDIVDITSPTFSFGDLEIQGNQGADSLWGSDGNDTLDGGEGPDVLAGGRGRDWFVLRLGESATDVALADRIRDFVPGEDVFALAGGLGDVVAQVVTDTDGVQRIAVKARNSADIYAVIDNLEASDLTRLGNDAFIAYAKDDRVGITGSLTEGATLRVDTAGLASRPVGAPIKVTWQQSDVIKGWIAVQVGTNDALVLQQSQVGQSIRALVSFIDQFGFERTLVSPASAVVANVNDAPTGAVTLSGKVTAGSSLVADASALGDEDGLGAVMLRWQASSDGQTWSTLADTGNTLKLGASLVGQRVRAQALYTDGGGASEVVSSSATDRVYGQSGASVVFPRNDDPSSLDIRVDQDLQRANAFAIDFDFSFDPSKVNSAFARRSTIAEVSLVPKLPAGEPITVVLGDQVLDLRYGAWQASQGSSLVGDVVTQERFTLQAQTYRAHLEVKTINDYQDVVAVLSKTESDGSITIVGSTSVRLTAPTFADARDFDLFIDGSYESGVQALQGLKVAITKLPKNQNELTGTPDADLLFGTSLGDSIYGFEGDDTIYGLEGDDRLDGGGGADFISGGAGADSIIGGPGNDTLKGDSGNDYLEGGGASDVLLGWAGDDVISVGGNAGQAFYTFVDGGSGVNTLSITYASGLGDFVSRKVAGEVWRLMDANGGVVEFKNIFNLDTSYGKSWWNGKITVGGKQYTLADDMRGDATPFSGAYGSVQSFVYQSGNGVEVALVEGGKFLPQYRMNGFSGFSLSGNENFTVYGTASRDVIFTGYAGDVITGGDGNDYIFPGDGRDTVYAGAGDDVLYLSIAALLEDAVLDGGGGSNTLAFIKPGEAGGWDNDSYGAINLDMSKLGVATGFQNVVATIGNDTVFGNSEANLIAGNSGNDSLIGGGGNDILYGDAVDSDTAGVRYGLNTYWAQGGGNDTLLGGAGNDQLFGGVGDDVLDGESGVDELTGGAGIDTFVIRPGSGGVTPAFADIIKDFTDGTDVIGLSGGVSFGDLIISQGDVANSVFLQGKTGEYFARINGIQPSSITYLDFMNLSSVAQGLSGTLANDVLIGAAGGDTIAGNGGSDVLLGWAGDDVISVGGNASQAFYTFVDGGSGVNTLSITYASGLGDFVSRKVAGEVWRLMDANGGVVEFKNIFNLDTSYGKSWWNGKITVGGKQYTLADDMRGDATPFSGAYGSVQSFVYQSGNGVEVALVEGGKFLPQYRMNGFSGFSLSGNENFTVYGTASRDVIFTGYAGDVITGGDGNDYIFPGDGRDTVYAGAGDDVLYLSIAALLEDAVLDGGGGSNTLAFIKPGEAGGWDNDSYGAINLDMSKLGVATGFQNVVATIGNDTVFGNSEANLIAGNSGNDSLIGGGGNDILYGDAVDSDTAGVRYGLNTYWAQGGGNDTLLGGAGNDQLFGGVGDDVLDGESGVDELTGGAGIDTFVIRPGSGGVTPAFADIIKDFTDGTDVIGLSGGVSFGDLIISQGDVANSVFLQGKTGEYFARINGIQPSSITYLDFMNLSSVAQGLSGTLANDVLIGAAGGDTIAGNGGSDVLLGWAGDDVISVGGNASQAFYTFVDGGSGVNTLSITYASGLGDFVSRKVAGEVWRLMDANGGVVEFKNIFNLDTSYGKSWWNGKITVGGKQYTLADDMRGDATPFSGAYGSVQSFVYQSGNGVEVALVEGGKFLPQYRMNGFSGFSLSGNENFTVYGTASRDVIFTGYAGDVITGGDGNDYIFPGDGRDTVYAGAGDDVLYLSIAALLEDAVLDGGGGSNTLAFIKPGEAGGWDNDSYGAINLDMSKLGVATGFQNVVATIGNDTVFGNSEANLIAGNSGNDSLIGGGGNDILYGDAVDSDTAGVRYGLNTYWAQGGGNDTLLGGAGNDQLFGGVGDDVLDGESGVDELTGGAGIDTFVIRPGSGGVTPAFADIIKDFTDGTDVIELRGGLLVPQLAFVPGTREFSGSTFVMADGEYLLRLIGISPDLMTAADFTS